MKKHRKHLLGASLLCCAIALSNSCSRFSTWDSFRGSGGTGKSKSSIETPLALRWKILLQKHSNSDRYFNQPIVMNNTIYFGSADGNFYSLDISSGYMNWVFRTNGPINSVACADAKAVYFGSSDGKIYALDRKSGEALWAYQTDGGVNSTVVIWKDRIVAAADTDAVYILYKDGSLDFTLTNRLWIRNSFQIHNDILAFAPGTPSNPHSLAVYDMERREYTWSLESGVGYYPWFSFPALDGSRLHYSATGFDSSYGMMFKYSCLDLKTGRTIWDVSEKARFSSDSIWRQDELFFQNTQLLDYAAPLVWRDQVIYASGDEYVRSFSVRNGKALWKIRHDQPVASAITLAADRLYYGLRASNGEGTLVCAAASNGKELWTLPLEGTILNSPVIAGRWILFGTDEGIFYVFERVL